MPPFDAEAEPADTREAIVRATYRALCEHGYADLTVQRIGDEFEKSKSLLYHHYDGKDDLLLDFLSFMLETLEGKIESREDQRDPAEKLREMLDFAIDPDLDEEGEEFRRAMVELRAQAAHDPDYREHFTRSDRVFRDAIADLVSRGIEEEAFRDVDPDDVASHTHTLIVGTMTRTATTDGVDVSSIREEADAYVESVLLAKDG